MKIYTKTGDRGDTRLFDGTTVRKDDPRVEAYGDIDELNSLVGAAAASVKDPEFAATLAAIQKDLFAIGAQLADPRLGVIRQLRPRFAGRTAPVARRAARKLGTNFQMTP